MVLPNCVVLLSQLLIAWTSVAQDFPCDGCFCKETWKESTLQVTNGIAYGNAVNKKTNKTETLLLNIYAPPQSDARKARPAILCIHGGGFWGHDRNNGMTVKWARHFAARGFVAASIDYRLEAGKPPNRTGIEQANFDAMLDAKAAVRYFVKNSAQLRVDKHRIAAFGSSAGGFTVAYMTAVPGEGESGNPGFPSNITAGVSLSGQLNEQKRSDIKADDPPYIDFHGTADPLVPFSTAQATKAAMDKAGAVNFLVPLSGAKHVPFPVLESHTEDVMGFLSKYMDLAGAECPKNVSKNTEAVV